MTDSVQHQTSALPQMKEIKHVLFIFIDGLGLGRNDPSVNPCCGNGYLFFGHCQDKELPEPFGPFGYVTGLDASLGLPGLPQSATGQTALLTGVNASAILGRHLNGFPNQKLRELIAEHSILKRLAKKGYRAAFLNTFRPPFFDYDPFEIIRYLSVTSVSNLYADLPFFSLDDLLQERSVYQDMTNHSLRQKGFDVPIFTPEKAGQIIGTQSQHYHFSLYEYFQTDFAGHAQEMPRAQKEIEKLDRFLKAVLDTVDLQETLVIVSSDHGNIEDLSVKGHTTNLAMTLIFGAGSSQVLPYLKSIVDVTPVILAALGVESEKD